MAKLNTPFTLQKFDVVEGDVAVAEVISSLRCVSAWMQDQQALFYASDFEILAQRLLDDDKKIIGSANSFGRELGIEPPVQADYQPYNMAEMFRQNIITKLAGYVASEAIVRIIMSMPEEDRSDAKKVKNAFKSLLPNQKSPTNSFLERFVERFVETGAIQGLPTPDGILPFSATDTHYSKLTRDGRKIFWTVKLPEVGRVTLRFTAPAGERFDGTPSRPTVRVKGDKIYFDFTIKEMIPETRVSPASMGVDLGKVETFVATVAQGDQYSPPIVSNRRANVISKKINRLSKLKDSLWKKEQLCKIRGHADKFDVLHTERLRVRSKISRLKTERCHAIARQLVEIAFVNNATIVLEDLSWVKKSGKWDQSRQQTVIEHAARRKGVPTAKRNSANTSKQCFKCRSVKHHYKDRTHVCENCGKRLDRDINASRVISSRYDKTLTFNKQCAAQTRVSPPVTPGLFKDKVNTSCKLYKKYNLIT